MSLQNLALILMVIGLSKVGIRFYDLLYKKPAWETRVPQTNILGKRLVVAYIKLLISVFPFFSFKISNKRLRWAHNILVILLCVFVLLVNLQLQKMRGY